MPALRRVFVLVEDNRRHQQLVQHALAPLLERNQLDVVVLENAAEANAFIQTSGVARVALLVCDGNLGLGPNGLDVLEAFVRSGLRSPFALFTSDGEWVRDAHARGWAAFNKRAGVEALAAWAQTALAGEPARPTR